MTQAKFAASTGGTYPLSVYKEFPADAIDIPDDLYADFLAGKTSRLTVVSGKVCALVDVPSLEAAILAQVAAINNSHALATQQAVVFTTEAGITQTYQADNVGLQSSQYAVQSAYASYQLLGETPQGYAWLAADNTAVPFTLADLGALLVMFSTQNYDAFKKRTLLKKKIRAATSVAAAQNITW